MCEERAVGIRGANSIVNGCEWMEYWQINIYFWERWDTGQMYTDHQRYENWRIEI